MYTIIGLVIAVIVIHFLYKRWRMHTQKGIFVTKVEPSWFSNEYAVIKFSNNNGVTWDYIRRAESPILEEDNWEYAKAVYNYQRVDFKKVRCDYFDTYEKCLENNRQALEETNKNNKKRNQWRLEKRQSIARAYGESNKKC